MKKAWRQSTKEVLKEDDCVEDGEKCEGFSPLLGSHWARERETGWGSDLQAKPPSEICPSPQCPYYFKQQPSINVCPQNRNNDHYSHFRIKKVSAKKVYTQGPK